MSTLMYACDYAQLYFGGLISVAMVVHITQYGTRPTVYIGIAMGMIAIHKKISVSTFINLSSKDIKM